VRAKRVANGNVAAAAVVAVAVAVAAALDNGQCGGTFGSAACKAATATTTVAGVQIN